jgi:choline dehydrogenase
VWIVHNASDAAPHAIFGISDAIPVTGDFNGDGRDEIAMFHKGEWFLDLNGNGQWDAEDLWAKLGNEGWGFEDVLPFFNRLEADVEFGSDPWHGDAGPLPITRYPDRELTPVLEAATQALQDAGFPAVDDHNRPGAIGAGRMPMTARDGVRVTTADAYLPLAADVDIRAESQVADLVLEADRVTSVRLLDGQVIQAGEVILCAGVYGNPPILMRSGLGPADELRSLGVAVRTDLAGVGANLADHPAVAVDCGYRGPGREDAVLHVAATFHSTTAPSDGAPDLMLWLCDPEEPDCFEIDAVLLKPRSRGRVRLRSADPADPPRIELPGLRDPADAERLAEGYRRALDVAGVRLGASELAERVRTEVRSLPHTVGTCAMGPRPDDGAVVDADGRVHGVDGLRIADASIMPDIPSGFTHLSTIMIAERLAEAVP